MAEYCMEHGIEQTGCWPCRAKTFGHYYREGRTVGRWQGALFVLALGAIALLLAGCGEPVRATVTGAKMVGKQCHLSLRLPDGTTIAARAYEPGLCADPNIIGSTTEYTDGLTVFRVTPSPATSDTK